MKKQVFDVITLKDILDQEDNKDDYFDASYRRGYMHGYDSAIDDTKANKNVIKIFNNHLMKWRFGKKPYKDLSEFECPPYCE